MILALKFVGTVYDQNLLKYIRNHAFCIYMAMRLVDQSGPLEALAQTDANLVLDVDFES